MLIHLIIGSLRKFNKHKVSFWVRDISRFSSTSGDASPYSNHIATKNITSILHNSPSFNLSAPLMAQENGLALHISMCGSWLIRQYIEIQYRALFTLTWSSNDEVSIAIVHYARYVTLPYLEELSYSFSSKLGLNKKSQCSLSPSRSSNI